MTPFTKYTSLETETLDQFESQDEFESNGPFSEQREQAYSYEHTHDHETEMVDQLSYEDNEQVEEADFSDELGLPDNPSPLSEYEIAQEIEHQVAIAKASNKKAGEKTRENWIKLALNRVLGLSLPDDNALDTATKNAIGDFQNKNNLPVTKNLDATTERALLEADALARSKGTPTESATAAVISAAKTKIEDWTKKAVNNKPQFILNTHRDPRKVFALVLHHMAFKRRNIKSKKYSDPESYLATGAHCCILFDGRIIQLHAFSRMIWHSNCTSGGSVGVEFEGNFPNVNGKWWVYKDDKGNIIRNDDKPTQAQYEAGRFLASYLKCVMGITRILAHRQSSKDRENDPGPDVWYNVGQWSIDKLGLSDGGPTSQCGDGKPILPEWRTWGEKLQGVQTKEISAFEEEECRCKKKRRPQEMISSGASDITSEYSWEADDEHVQEAEAFSEGESHDYEETEEFVRDWSEAVKANRYYGEKLQWNRYTDKINDMLLPLSGMSNVSLGEEAFAAAVFQWQTKNGFTGNNIDGVIGPATWTAMRQKLGIATTTTLPKDSRFELINGMQIRFAQKSSGGWAAYGGGLLREKLYELKNNKKLNISDTEIKLFELVSQPESGRLVGAINSYDNMGMSMGFLQFTLRSNELVELIKRAPSGFQKYGIELDPVRKYTWSDGSSTMALKNVPTISDLKSLDLAKRFFAAGLEEDVIVNQIAIGREHLYSIRKRNDPNGYLNRFNDKYPEMWAFIYEAFNSRPAILHPALKVTIQKAASQGLSDHIKFANLLFENLKTGTANYYGRMSYKTDADKQSKIKSELEKVGRVYDKTFLGKK
jgi:peptidoglycan hydrolase-like protein with peptidoglycan-binding domain